MQPVMIWNLAELLEQPLGELALEAQAGSSE